MNLGCEGLRHFPKRAIAPAFTTAAETCSRWRKHTMGPVGLIHDNSNSLVKDRWRSDLLPSPDIEQRTIGLPHRTRIYTLNVTRTEFADSRTHLQLQFCDLPAGAAAAWCRKFLAEPHLGDYAKQLEGAESKNCTSIRSGRSPKPIPRNWERRDGATSRWVSWLNNCPSRRQRRDREPRDPARPTTPPGVQTRRLRIRRRERSPRMAVKPNGGPVVLRLCVSGLGDTSLP